MSDGQQETQEFPTNPVADRLRKVKELAEVTGAGMRATADSTAMMVSSEAKTTSDATGAAAQELAGAMGQAVTGTIDGVARSTGAVAGGTLGAAGGLLLALQISGAATWEAARSLAGSSGRAAGRMAEGCLVALDDQAQGADQVREATSDLAQEVFDATANVALGALGGLATAIGAVAGGAHGAVGGSFEGAKRMADAGAEATWVVGKEASRGSTEVLRRTLRRPADSE
jgi:hypothetical protein